MRTLIRQDDTMVAVETASATIDFEEILEATEVVADDLGDAPWENCDGLEHTVKPAYRIAHFDVEQMRGYCYCDGHRENIVITLPEGEDYGLYKWHRERGAAKQVAREAVAIARRQTLNQLVKWYSDGWEYWGVKCDFEVLGSEFHDSVWGIDDADYAESEVIPEIADSVADQLEKAGFTVTGRPDHPNHTSDRANKQTQLRYNLNLQNWRD